MADAIPAANAELLAAQAQSGMAGVKAYQDAQATLAVQKQAAVQTAMQEAALRGAPAGAAQSQSSIITQPYDTRITSLAQGQAGFQADMAARDRRYADYQGAVGEARTLIPGEVEKIVAPIRAQGQATIANTTRQGQMAVDQINANNQLALTRMRAAEQAAQIAEAKAAAKAAAAAKDKAMTISGTDLEAMASRGALGYLQSTAAAHDTLSKNEAAQSTAKTNFETARTAEVTQGQRNRLQNLNEGQARDQIHVPLPAAAAAPAASPAVVGLPPKPTPPSRVLTADPEAYKAAVAEYQQKLAQWTAITQVMQQPNGGVPMGVMPPSAPAAVPHPMGPYSSAQMPPAQPRTAEDVRSSAAAAQALELAKQKQQQALAASKQAQATGGQYQPGMNSLVAAMGTTGKLNDPKLYSSQYGSITAEQYAEMQQTNPWLATVFGASPEALTSQNFGSLVEGVPDVNNQTTDFSHQVSQSASEQAIIDLRKQGYQFTDADAQNAIGADIKPGETAAQYNSRITGQMLPQDQAKAIATQDAADRKKVDDARSDQRYTVWWNDQVKNNTPNPVTGLTPDQMTDVQKAIAFQQAMAAVDPMTGLPAYDPATGVAVTASPAAKAAAANTQATAASKQSDAQASQWLVDHLGSIPPSSFGTPSQIMSIVTAKPNPSQMPQPIAKDPGLDAPFMSILNKLRTSYPSMVISNKNWEEQISGGPKNGPMPEFAALTAAQKSLLKHLFSIVTDKNFDVSAPS